MARAKTKGKIGGFQGKGNPDSVKAALKVSNKPTKSTGIKHVQRGMGSGLKRHKSNR